MQNPPPCLFFASLAAEHHYCSCLFKPVCQEGLQTIVSKQLFCGRRFRFCDVKFNKNESPSHSKSIQNRVWGRPGGSCGRLGDHFGPRMAQGLKIALKNREKVVFFLAPKSRLGPAFRGLVLYSLLYRGFIGGLYRENNLGDLLRFPNFLLHFLGF